MRCHQFVLCLLLPACFGSILGPKKKQQSSTATSLKAGAKQKKLASQGKDTEVSALPSLQTVTLVFKPASTAKNASPYIGTWEVKQTKMNQTSTTTVKPRTKNTKSEQKELQLSGNTAKTKGRKSLASERIQIWRKIYTFTIKLSKLVGNNALMTRVKNIMDDDQDNARKSNIYGYGYSYQVYYAPVVYYVPVAIQTVGFPVSGIYGLTQNFGNTVSNTELIEQLIQLIQEALDYEDDEATEA